MEIGGPFNKVTTSVGNVRSIRVVEVVPEGKGGLRSLSEGPTGRDGLNRYEARRNLTGETEPKLISVLVAMHRPQ